MKLHTMDECERAAGRTARAHGHLHGRCYGRTRAAIAWLLWPALLALLAGPTMQETGHVDAGQADATLTPLHLVPAESLLCWNGRPLPDTKVEDGPPGAIATLLDLGTRLAGGPLDARARLAARMLECFGLMIRYPHALALIDAQARPREGGADSRKVDRLRMVMVVQTGGKSEPFLKVIQKAVNEQTDRAAATLQRKSAGSLTYQELRDQRLPEWCVLAWGNIGDLFVLALGEGVWPQVAALARGEGESLVSERWSAEARHERAGDALIEIFVRIGGIRERLDPFVQERASAFFRAWRADDIDRAHWALGFEGRALYCIAHFQEAGRTRRRVFADAGEKDAKLLAVVPESARYAVYRFPAEQLFPRLIQGLLSTRGQDTRAAAERMWTELSAQYGFDAQRDFLSHLGERIVLHNDPPHPLRLPLAMTTLIEVRDEPALVKRTLDKLCTAWQDMVNRGNEENPVPEPWSVQRDGGGVWYLQLGPVAGPAWTCTDRYFITSWSPAALHQYLEKMGEKAGKR